MPKFTRLTGINGRRIAMSASGVIVDKNGDGCLTVDASGVRQMALREHVESISSSGAALSASGVSYLASGTATAQNFTLGAPSSGQLKEIYSFSSATTITLETTGATITFVTTGTSSSALTIAGAAGQFGQSVLLRGVSTSRWVVNNKTGQVT